MLKATGPALLVLCRRRPCFPDT